MIRKLVFKTFLFIIISAIFISILFILVIKGVDVKADFKLNSSIDYVFLGHSHTEYAYNDKIIRNSKNLAQSGEAYIYTYAKLKKLINQNKKLKAVFIEFSNNQIDHKMDRWMWSEEFLNEKLPLYMPFLNKNDIENLFKGNPKVFKNTLSKAFRNNLTYVLTFQFKYLKKIGGYRVLNKKILESKIQEAKIKYKNFKDSIGELKNYSISKKNLEYLQKSIALCEKNDISVYLIRTPTQKYYKYLNNDQLFIKIRETKFKNIDFLDFKDFPLYDDDFADSSHLNKNGAYKLSSFFNQLINDGLLNVSNKQTMINQNIFL